MVIISVVTTGAEIAVLAISPTERWYAARRLGGDLLVGGWFIPAALAAIVVLTLLFVAVSYSRAVKEKKSGSRLFLTYAEKRGLSSRECQTLLDIAARSELRGLESIFTMPTAFDRGAARARESILKSEGTEAGKHFGSHLSALREKLGFRNPVSARGGSATPTGKPSTRQIPIGKKLFIRPTETLDLAEVESTVIKNDNLEFAVVLSALLEMSPGQLCRAQYYFGAAVWEFDASVLSCHAGILVLNHTDDVRFINRRRFLRVPVNRPAFIARFPFAKTLLSDNDYGREDSKDFFTSWGPPQFVPAAVTELAGPGLRVEAPLEVKVGERVVVILKVSDEERRESSAGVKVGSLPPVSAQNSRNTTPSRVVEDVGQVRHIEAIQGGFSIAVELTGLSDSNVDELVRATNAASMKAVALGSDEQNSDADEYEQPEAAVPMVAQGV